MRIERDVPLAPRTTLGIGGAARANSSARRRSASCARRSHRRATRCSCSAAASNLVVGDARLAPGASCRSASPGIATDGTTITVVRRRGVVWDELVAQMVAEGRTGIECLSGIPGLVGATPMQNVGAYGQEVADTIVRVHARSQRSPARSSTFDPRRAGSPIARACSRARRGGSITSVAFRLPRSATSAPIRYAELAKRARHRRGGTAPLAARARDRDRAAPRQGHGRRSARSRIEERRLVLHEPARRSATLARLDARARRDACRGGRSADGMTKLSAGWLIERAGFAKGYTVGRVGISKKHALALVNRGGATAAELLGLATEITDGVRARSAFSSCPSP